MATQRLRVVEEGPTPRAQAAPEPVIVPPKPDEAPPIPPPEPRPPIRLTVREPDDAEKIEAAAKMLAFALSARALLFVAVVGALLLCGGVLFAPSVIRVVAVTLVTVFTVGPLTFLELYKGRQ